MKKGARKRLFLFLPLHSHSLHWHRHAPCSAAAARKLIAFEGDDALALSLKVDLVVDYVGGSHYVEAGVIEGLQSVLVAAVADEFSWLKAEKVATAVPLFAGGIVVVAVAAIHWFEVDADALQSSNQVGHFLAHGFLSVDGDVEGLESRIQDDGLVNHALVHVKHGEHHVKMDERLGCERQLLEDKVLHARFGLQVFDEAFHAVHVGAGAQATDDDIVADDLHVAAFHRADAMHVVVQRRLHDFGLKHGVKVVDGFQYHALAGANLRGHAADHQVVEHRERGVAHEKQVGQRAQQVLLFLERGNAVHPHAFDEFLRQLFGGHAFKVVGNHEAVFGLADAVDEAVFDAVVLKDVGQQVADFVDLSGLLQHALEIAVFLLCDLQVQDVAKQIDMSVFGCHVLDFGSWHVDQNML